MSDRSKEGRSERGRVRTRMPLRYSSVILALLIGVMLPVLLSTTAGIISVVQGESSRSLVLGVLVISLTAAAVGGVIATVVLLGRRARLARMQADLLANISHELKTPLSAIRMMAQTLLVEGASDDPTRRQECLDIIVRQSRWLEDMIERVLTWRSARGDRSGLDLIVAPLGPSLDKAIERYQRMIEPGEDSLRVLVDSDRPVEHDPIAFGAIAMNLLVNAYKYTPEEKDVRVCLRDEGPHVVLEVRDNGVGVPEGEREHIFEPFYRLEDRLGAKASGTGLGLAIVRHLVLAHDGQAGVDRDELGGSRFWVKLPAFVSEESEEEVRP